MASHIQRIVHICAGAPQLQAARTVTARDAKDGDVTVSPIAATEAASENAAVPVDQASPSMDALWCHLTRKSGLYHGTYRLSCWLQSGYRISLGTSNLVGTTQASAKQIRRTLHGNSYKSGGLDKSSAPIDQLQGASETARVSPQHAAIQQHTVLLTPPTQVASAEPSSERLKPFSWSKVVISPPPLHLSLAVFNPDGEQVPLLPLKTLLSLSFVVVPAPPPPCRALLAGAALLFSSHASL